MTIQEERVIMAVGGQGVALEYPRAHVVPELFAAQVATHPDAEALCCGSVSLSYAELEQRANRLAHWLIGAGVGPEQLVALVLPILILGLFVFRMPYDEVAGIVSGACGNAAILGYSNKLTSTDRPDIAYAMIFPGMTIVKILFVVIASALS